MKYQPELLLKHHSVENLELWSCHGCQSFLIRVARADSTMLSKT